MNAIRDWWRGRSRREQVLVGIMLLIAVPIIGWFLIIAPANAWHDRARADYIAASDRYGRVKALSLGVTGEEAPAPVVIEGALAEFVSVSADQAGFALTANNAQGPDRTAIAVAQARAPAALQWIGQLRAAGVRVEALSMTDNGEGGVRLDLTLAKARAS